MMRPLVQKTLAAGATVAITLGLGLATSAVSVAYEPGPKALFTAGNTASCNKSPCVLYPKATQLPSGRLVAAFEDSQSVVVGQDMPIHKSDDFGTTWQALANVKAPAQMSTDPKYAKYTSNWTNPYLYVLPEAVGTLPAGTLLLASVVSGDDEYYNEHKAADPNWRPTGDGDRRDLAIALYSSADQGASWQIRDIIATGGWQGGSAGAIGRVSAANTNAQVDPLWEPHLLVHQGKLVAYYSDENDYLGYDAATGIPVLDPNNATAPDSHGQILVHKTWDGTSNGWSQPVVDVAGLTENRGGGKTQIGGGRPGMITVAPTTDNKWLMTWEYFGGGANTRIKSCTDLLSCRPDDLGQTSPGINGGSPVLLGLPDGRIVYNDADSGELLVNESGRSDGSWKRYLTSMPAGYSRNLTYVNGTGRVQILQAGWNNGSIGPVLYGDLDLGRSAGAYYSIVNRKTGQILSTDADKTQDASLTGNVPDIISWTNNPANDTQRWHVVTKGSSVTLLNKAGGRSVGIWEGNASQGVQLAQWVDDGGNDKLWNMVTTTDGYVKFQSVRNPSLYITGAAGYGAIGLGASLASSSNAAADDAQEWKLVEQVAGGGS